MADSYEVGLTVEFIISTLGSFQVTPAKSTGVPKYSITRQALANGDNTFAVPTGVNWCLILFDPASGTPKKLKGAGGDTGITLAVNSPILIAAASGNVIINSTGADATITQVIFF